MFTVAWPKDTPDDVRRLADTLAAVLQGHSGQVAGPATAFVFAYLIAELGGADVGDVVRDVGALACKHGAMNR
jgi:hypothetical protein